MCSTLINCIITPDPLITGPIKKKSPTQTQTQTQTQIQTQTPTQTPQTKPSLKVNKKASNSNTVPKGGKKRKTKKRKNGTHGGN